MVYEPKIYCPLMSRPVKVQVVKKDGEMTSHYELFKAECMKTKCPLWKQNLYHGERRESGCTANGIGLNEARR